MPVQINTSFHPFRLRVSDKKPVQLKVTLKNVDADDKMISLDVILSRDLSFDKGGLRNSDRKRIKRFQSKGELIFYYDVWPKQTTVVGDHPILVELMEHFNNYEYVQRDVKKKLELPVMD